MNQFRKFTIILILAVATLTACGLATPSQTPDESAKRGLKIVTTFPPLFSFVSNLADESAVITNLVPPGASVHTWEPSASALKQLSGADLLVMNGLELEHFMEDILESVQNPKLKIIVTSDAVQNEWMELDPMLELEEEGEHEMEVHPHGGTDPHVWLSPALAVKQVEAIRDALMQIDTEKAVIYQANTASYVAELKRLDQDIRSRLNVVTKKDFIVFHGAYGYFLKEYGLDAYQKTVIEPFPGKEPTASYFSSLIDLIDEEGVSVIFTEPQFNPRVVQNIQEETGAKSFEIDPIGLELSKEAYIKNINAITDAFVKAFTD